MISLRRRALLQGLMLGSLAAPGLAMSVRRGFTHSVGSFDPVGGAITLWTRYVGADESRLGWEIAEDAEFGRVVKRGETLASVENDWCARVTIPDLDPGRWYFYRFTAPDLTRSDVGRTKTLPVGKLDRYKIAVFSCSNLPAGWFNAYAHAAARNDIDLVLHLGDYIYEYPQGGYPEPKDELPGRLLDPAGEIYRLEDYRRRYATYRRDPDLQRLHQLFPAITIWDDHEFANDAWTGGAQNHQAATEGNWDARKAMAKRAYHEWLPIGDTAFASYDIGDLLTLMRLDTRIEGRMQAVDLGFAKADTVALAAFRDGPWRDPQRTLLGFPQERWLADALKASVKAKTRWQVVAQQVIMGNLSTPASLTPDSLGPNPPEYRKRRFTNAVAAAKVGLPFNMDSWGGYITARDRLLTAAQSVDSNMIVLAGDSHNAWAFDLAAKERPAGVEFAVQGVTSPGFEGSVNVRPDVLASALVAQNRELKWCDTAKRGYMTVTLTRDEARCDWHLLDSVRERSVATTTRSATVARGRKKLALL